MRELPRGAMTRARGGGVRRRLVASCSSSRPGSSGRSASRCRRSRSRSCSGIRSPSASRSYTQLFLGLAMAVAPVGGWLAAGGARRLGAVAARPRDRHLGRRLRRALCLPGSRVRSRARAAVDPGALRRRRVAARSRAPCTSSTVVCLAALAAVADLGWIYLAGVAGVARAARLRAVARQRARSLAGQARVRSQRLRRHPLPRGHGAGDLCPLTRRAHPSRSRSPAPAARSTRRGRWRRCSSAAATSS